MAQEQRKAFRKLFGYIQPLRLSSSQVQDLRKGRRLEGKSSATILGGDIVVGGSGESLIVRTNVAAMASYRLLSQTGQENYKNKAGISLDGIFVPYTTDTSSSGYFPHFTSPSEDSDEPTCTELNPFGENGIAMAFPDSEGLPDNICTEYTNYNGSVRAIGLKAPLIVGGWGYDTDGLPVPRGSGDAFLENYKNRADQWKVGPVDLRWSEERGVWVTGGSESLNIKTLELQAGLIPGGSAKAKEWIIRHDWEDGDSDPFVAKNTTNKYL